MAFGDFTVVRSTVKNVFNSSGVLAEVAVNTPAFQFNPDGTYRGLLPESASTNGIRNNTGAGAVVGAPGTLPTNWTEFLSGLTREVVATGTENGVEYVDIKLSGTATNSPALISPESTTGIVASSAQVWTSSFFIKNVTQTLPPLSTVIEILERTSDGTFVSGGNSSALTLTSALSRYSFTRTLSGGATVARVQPRLAFGLTIGASYDFTVRIGLPQMEQIGVATSPIKTSGTALTRGADVVTLTSGSSLIGQTEGTMFAEVNIANSVAVGFFNIDDGDTSDFISINKLANLTIQVRIRRANGSFVNIITSSALSLGTHKIALGYENGDYALYIDGVQAGTSANSTDFPATTISRIVLSNSQYGQFNDHLHSVVLFPTRLSNSQLQALTT